MLTETCSSCATVLKVRDEFAGKKIRCPKCQAVMTARPAAQEASAPKVAAPPVANPVAPAPRRSTPPPLPTSDDDAFFEGEAPVRKPRPRPDRDDDDDDEPAPKPRRRPVRDYDDEDDEPAPRRRRRPARDYDDDEADDIREPRPRGRIEGQTSAMLAMIGIALVLLIEIGSVVVGFAAIAAGGRRGAGTNVVFLGFLFSFLATIVSGIVFLIWFSTAHANLRLLNAKGLAYSPGWAVGGFFVPFLNLVRPYQVAQEIWKASDPDGVDPEDARRWRFRAGSPLIVVWWISWLVSGFLGNIAGRAAGNAESLLFAMLFLSVCHIVSGVCLIVVIRAVMARQTEKYRLLWDDAD